MIYLAFWKILVLLFAVNILCKVKPTDQLKCSSRRLVLPVAACVCQLLPFDLIIRKQNVSIYQTLLLNKTVYFGSAMIVVSEKYALLLCFFAGMKKIN